jgi:hypothetical protein
MLKHMACSGYCSFRLLSFGLSSSYRAALKLDLHILFPAVLQWFIIIDEFIYKNMSLLVLNYVMNQYTKHTYGYYSTYYYDYFWQD